MADHILESRVWLARPRVEVFAFFADPANLPRLAPPALRLRLLAPPAPMRAGSVYDFRVAWLGVPLRRRAVLRRVGPPQRVRGVQGGRTDARRGHRHRFLEENGGTWGEGRGTCPLPPRTLGRAAPA